MILNGQKHKKINNNKIDKKPKQSYIILLMKVELSKDALFKQKQSPVKQLKQRELQRQKFMRINRMNPIIQKIQPDIEIVNPLPAQIQTYKEQTTILKTFENSRASKNLRKYLIEQEKNLKCLRLERLNENQFRGSVDLSNPENSMLENTVQSRYLDSAPSKSKQNMLDKSQASNTTLLKKSKSRNAGLSFDFLESQLLKQNTQEDRKPIDIPPIEKLFQNQQKQFVLYDSKLMKNSLQKSINSISKSVQKISQLKFKGIKNANQSLYNSTNSAKTGLFPPINHISQPGSVINEDDMEIDDRIERKLKKSQRIRSKIQRQKKQLQNFLQNLQQSSKKQTSTKKELGFLMVLPQKSKKKVYLKGDRAIRYNDGDKDLQIMPASSLLFELNRLGKGKLRKQKQLSGLLTNSYKNRDDILDEKSSFYDQETPFSDLSSSSQFKLRKQMDKRLKHRLELSREQVNKFTSYLYEIKEQYHVILDQNILNVLKNVREELMSGKVMKSADLSDILGKIKKNNKKMLEGYPNEVIVNKLYEMMI